MPVKEKLETRVNYNITYPAAEGKEPVVEELFSEVEGSKGLLKKLDEAKAKGATVEQTRGVTFRIVQADDPDDFLVMVTPLNPDGTPGEPNKVEAVNIWNRGAVLKQQKEMRDVMESSDAVEGTYDLATVLPETVERRTEDPLERASRDLKKAGIDIPPDLLKSVLAQFAKQPAPATA